MLGHESFDREFLDTTDLWHLVPVGLLAITEIPQSRSAKFPTPGVLLSLVAVSFRSLFSGLGLVGA